MIITDVGSTFTAWDEMFGELLPRVPSAPTFEMERALRAASDEFFRVSRIWRTKPLSALLVTVADQDDYDYSPPDNAQVSDIVVAWNGTDEVGVIKPYEYDEQDPGDTDADTMIGCRPSNILFLTPTPVASDIEIKGTLVFKPSDAAVGIPALAWSLYSREIVCGAAAELASQQDKPWTDRNAVDWLSKQFGNGISLAANLAGPAQRRPRRVSPL